MRAGISEVRLFGLVDLLEIDVFAHDLSVGLGGVPLGRLLRPGIGLTHVGIETSVFECILKTTCNALGQQAHEVRTKKAKQKPPGKIYQEYDQ